MIDSVPKRLPDYSGVFLHLEENDIVKTSVIKRKMVAFWNSLDGLNSVKEFITALFVFVAVFGWFIERRAARLQAAVDKEKDLVIAVAKENASKAILHTEELKKANLELQNQIVEAEKRIARRRLDADAFVARLKGKPKLSVEIIYQPEDYEAFQFASNIHRHLGNAPGKTPCAGWDLLPLRPINKEDELAAMSHWQNAPSSARAGAWEAGLGMVTKKPLDFDALTGAMDNPDSPDPLGALAEAFRISGYTTGIIQCDPKIPTDLRIIVGPKL